ncbi:unnamed protein product [Symbiodinium necroappetens]|uniref:Uncharacterized protein n=1 Tax=Symbiodinium necroappetens TaxID=1628268 RepID=A0A812LEZ3_9DINO|nr:unnamed protein product [Symbiodinium necroappetens]
MPAQPPADTIAGAEVEAEAADADSGLGEGKNQGSTLPPIATGASVPPEVQTDANGGKAEGGTVEASRGSKEMNATDVTLPPISSADPQPRPAEERMLAEVEISPEPPRKTSAPRASSTKQAREDARRRILAARAELQRRVAEATEARLKRQAEAEAHARERAEQAQKMAQKRLAQRRKKSESATPDSKRGEASTETSTSSPGRSSSPGKNVPQDLPGLKPAKARVKRKIQKARDAQEARLKEIEEDRRRSEQRKQAQAEAAEVLRAQAARRAGERMRREKQAEANERAQRYHDLQQARERQQLYRSPKKIAELIAAAASVAHSNVEERKHAARHTESYLQKERQRASICTVRAEEVWETDNQLAMLQIKADRHHQPDVDAERVHAWSVVYEFPLPDSLAQLPFWDPEFKALNESAQKYALQQQPGKGGILDYQIVRSSKTHKFHRVWGGPAKKCGYWWTLSHPLAIAPDGNLTLTGLQEACGVCPEWNTAAVLETCYGKPGWAFVVGQGNSATCQDGETLFPPGALLQVNGDVCSNSLTCESCDLKRDINKCMALLGSADSVVPSGRHLDGEGDDRPFGDGLRKEAEVRRSEPEDEDAFTPQHVRRMRESIRWKAKTKKGWAQTSCEHPPMGRTSSSSSSAAAKKKKRKAKKAAKDQGKHKKAKKEKSVDMGFEAALAAAAKERAAAATSTGGTDTSEKVKPKEGSGKKLRPATQGLDSAKAPLLSSSKCEVVDAFSYDPTKKPDADYSKPDPLSVANSGLDIQRRIYEHDRSEYNADQLRRCDAIARGSRHLPR